MSYLPPPSATQWTIRNIVSTRTVQCWVGMMRETSVEPGTPHCRSSQIRTSTTCFSGLSQTVIIYSPTLIMCGLMLKLAVSATLLSCIGLKAIPRASNHTICWSYNFSFTDLFGFYCTAFLWYYSVAAFACLSILHYHQLVNLKSSDGEYFKIHVFI